MKALLLAFLTAVAVPVSAAVIYDNGAPDLQNAYPSDAAPTSEFQGQAFTLADAHTVRDVHWWGTYAPTQTPGVDQFTIQFFNIVAGVPSAVSFAEFAVTPTRVDTGTLIIQEYTNYRYATAIPDLALAAGSYLISIYNDTTADADDQWFWATSDDSAATGYYRSGLADPWNLGTPQLAFFLTDDGLIGQVPEPSSVILFATALALLAFTYRRRKLLPVR